MILIYTKSTCSFCCRAKDLLTDLNQTFTEIDLLLSPECRDEMIKKANGASSVPQIFIEGKHIGGCDDLYNLHKKKMLEPLFK